MKNERILVVGGGGREHAIIKKLSESKNVSRLYCAPGNAGIAELAECHAVKATDIEGMVALAKSLAVTLVFVAPDDPLAMGMVDALEAAGIRAFGPTKRAAEIESSKIFAKNLMKRYGIPTARFAQFDDFESAKAYCSANPFPTVIKADGLALGKGVVIAKDLDEAVQALDAMMNQGAFGSSGTRVVIEECLSGPEVSVLAFTDGTTVLPMMSAQDHKRAYDGDRGPNTGGMGAFSPSKNYTDEIAAICERTIFQPTIQAMQAEGRPFRGVLYFGLMLCEDGPKVIEYNARFGDPETQVVLPRLKTDLVELMDAVMTGTLDRFHLEWDDREAVCVVAASGGYPTHYEKGYVITGLDRIDRSDVTVYHAGTAADGEKIVTAGGRVLGVTALAPTIPQARDLAYNNMKRIHFEGMFYRADIGIK